jgi:hypothetical protein
MVTLLRLLVLALVALPLASAPAGAQQRLQPDRGVKIRPAVPESEQDQADPGHIMRRVLPFIDGQTMRYYNPDRQLEGYARRRGLTIRFYDAQDNYLGRAQRVSQEMTRYYAADGTYLGRRINQKQATASHVTVHHTAPAPTQAAAGPGN